jgi:hypothetical protein
MRVPSGGRQRIAVAAVTLTMMPIRTSSAPSSYRNPERWR